MPFAEQTLAVRVKSTGVDSFRTAIDSAAGSLGSLKTSAGLAAGALGAIAFAKTAKSAAEFNSAMTESLAIMDDMGEGMEENLEQKALDVARTTQVSANEAAESYFYLASAGMDAQQSMQNLDEVARFAQAGQFEMARATELLTDAQSAMGLAVEDNAQNQRNLVRVSDVLVNANQQANATVEQFSESLTNRAAPALKSANKDLEEGVAVLAAFADQGIKGRRAGMQLSRILRRLSEGAAENTEEFQRLGLVDAQGNLAELSTIVEVLEDEMRGLSDAEKSARLEQLGFNARVQQSIKPLLGMSDEIKEYESNLRDAGGATEEVADKQMQSFSAQVDLLRSRLNTLAIESGGNFLGMMAPLVGLLNRGVTAFTEINAATNGWLGTVVIAGALLTGLVTVIGMASGVVTGTLVPAFLAGAGVITGLGSSALFAIPGMSGLAAAINATSLPLLAVIAFIGTLIGVIALLASNAGGLRDRWFNIWQEIKFETLSVIDTIIGAINKVLDAIPGIGTQLDTVLGDTSKREFLAQRTREVGSGEDFTGGLGGMLEGAAGGVMDLLGGGGGGAAGGAGGLAAAAGAGGAAGGGRMSELQKKLDASVAEMENTSSNIDQGIKETSEKIGEVTEKQETREVQGDRRVAREAAGGAAAGAGRMVTRERGGTELDVDVTFDTTDDNLTDALRDLIDVRVARKDTQRNRDLRRRGRKA